MPFEITKSFRFEAAHRLPDHKGRCRYLHGHSYRIFVTIQSHVLDEMGMVLDFGELDCIKTWIELYLDHNTLLWKKDEELIDLIHETQPTRKPFVCEKLPTAEHIAQVIFEQAEKLLIDPADAFKVVKVTVFETETSCASYSKE